jgi:16S rRNA (guanine1516-N2)-methyltransferase
VLRVPGGPAFEVAFGCDRRAAGSARHSPLLRAAGVPSGVRTVADATAGLGRDGWTLALAGCSVTMIERCPWLAEVLIAAQQAALHAGIDAATRVAVIGADARQVLRTLAVPPETVLLDPMFPPHGKSALPRRELQVLRRVLGPGSEDPDLLDCARRAATRRAVVKRRPTSPPLGDIAPAASVRGLRVRFDIYPPLS